MEGKGGHVLRAQIIICSGNYEQPTGSSMLGGMPGKSSDSGAKPSSVSRTCK